MGFEKTAATILITGATDGLGKEAARKLAAQGARLILHGRNEAKLQAVVSAIQTDFPDARIDTILADFSSLAQVRAMAAELNERFERPGCAGKQCRRPAPSQTSQRGRF